MIFKLQCCPKTIYGKQTCRNKMYFFRNVIGHPGQVFIRCLLDHVRFYQSGAIGFIFCLRGECHRRIESKFTHHFILSSAFVLSYRQIRQPSNQETVASYSHRTSTPSPRGHGPHILQWWHGQVFVRSVPLEYMSENGSIPGQHASSAWRG